MLREIIEFINSLGNHLHHDNVGDFLRNIMANFISDKIVSKWEKENHLKEELSMGRPKPNVPKAGLKKGRYGKGGKLGKKSA